MARNVEIKAYAGNWWEQQRLAAELADGPSETIHQEDIFFIAPHARLKLRIFSETHGHLIAYRRADQAGPKQSEYEISETDQPRTLERTLAMALPIFGKVIKTRYLFMVNRTRIHFDEVQDLGRFIELEVVLGENESTAAGEKEAQHLTDSLLIKRSDLIQKAYIDLLHR